jgi:hypothetical protein
MHSSTSSNSGKRAHTQRYDIIAPRAAAVAKGPTPSCRMCKPGMEQGGLLLWNVVMRRAPALEDHIPTTELRMGSHDLLVVAGGTFWLQVQHTHLLVVPGVES